MILSEKILAPIIVLFFVGGIAGTMVFNLWQTEASKEPAKIKEGKFAGMSDPNDIRGSYSFQDINNVFDIDVEVLGKAFEVHDVNNLSEFQCKKLEDMYGEVEGGEIGTGSVRLFVALYKGLPYVLDDETLLPSSAISILKEKISHDDFLIIEKLSVDLSKIVKNSKTADEHGEDNERKIKGKTTFKELEQWGLSREDIEKVLGISMGKSGETVRDFCTANNIEFSGIKTALQELIDTKK
jgi:hypothetical protein